MMTQSNANANAIVLSDDQIIALIKHAIDTQDQAECQRLLAIAETIKPVKEWLVQPLFQKKSEFSSENSYLDKNDFDKRYQTTLIPYALSQSTQSALMLLGWAKKHQLSINDLWIQPHGLEQKKPRGSIGDMEDSKVSGLLTPTNRLNDQKLQADDLTVNAIAKTLAKSSLYKATAAIGLWPLLLKRQHHHLSLEVIRACLDLGADIHQQFADERDGVNRNQSTRTLLFKAFDDE